jgi:hypothetical protein
MAPNELSKESICRQQIAKRRPDKDNEAGFDRQQFMLINIDWRDVLVADECIKTHCRVSLPQHHATHGAGRASAPYRRVLMKRVANHGPAARTERVIGRENLCRLSLHHGHHDTACHVPGQGSRGRGFERTKLC